MRTRASVALRPEGIVSCEKLRWTAVVVALCGLVACDCGGTAGNDGGTSGGGGTAGGGGAPGGGGGSVGGGGGGDVSECDQSANVQYRDALLAAQPQLQAKSKQLITATVTFQSQVGGSAATCPVQLRFKDLDGDSAVTDYEDWRKTPAERAAALLPRMTAAQKQALLAHPSIADVPAGTSPTLSAALQALIDGGVRFGRTSAPTAALTPRAAWANAVQERCEASALGIPFVLSSEPSHSSGNGRVKAKGFSQWPAEQGLAAGDLASIEGYGKIVSQEYRAIGVRMALSVSADLYTDPRWYVGQFGWGEDAALVAQRTAAFVRGAQGAALGRDGVACVVGSFPGAGAAKGGWDARLAKGRWLSYAGGGFDAHVGAFEAALTQKVAGVMPALGMPERGAWSGLGGLVDGASVEEVGAVYSRALVGDVLRSHYQYGGLVLAPWGALDDAPWGMEPATRAARIAKAMNAGVDQFGGLDDLAPVAEALGSSLITAAQIDAAAGRALAVAFALGLFENPYVDAAQAPAKCNTDASYRAGLNAMNAGMVLLHNAQKPAGWLNGNGDGTQVGDKGNAGNGSMKVLPAPPGEPYVSAGCSYYILGDFDLDYVRSVSTGYGELTNDSTVIKGVPVTTAAQRIALSDYVFIRIRAPFTADPDGAALGLPTQSLEYGAGSTALADLAFARNAIASWSGTPASKTQLVVGVDLGRPAVVSEIMAYAPSALYVQWAGAMPANLYADKVFLDVAFGIVNGTGALPTGLPLSNVTAGEQKCDVAGDGQHPTYVKGYGLQTRRFE